MILFALPFAPGDAYVAVLGKSAYGIGLNVSEYRCSVDQKSQLTR